MKRIIITLALAMSLSACAQKAPQVAVQNDKQPIFLKDGVSDRQMIRDLNTCSKEAFKDTEDGTVPGDVHGPQIKCMTGKGYEVSYN